MEYPGVGTGLRDPGGSEAAGLPCWGAWGCRTVPGVRARGVADRGVGACRDKPLRAAAYLSTQYKGG